MWKYRQNEPPVKVPAEPTALQSTSRMYLLQNKPGEGKIGHPGHEMGANLGLVYDKGAIAGERALTILAKRGVWNGPAEDIWRRGYIEDIERYGGIWEDIGRFRGDI
jgi:hypothetical protein